MKAWIEPVRHWLRRRNGTVLATLGLAAVTAGVYLVSVRPASQELDELQHKLAMARAQHQLRTEHSVRHSPRLQLVRFYATFPAGASAPSLLERIHAAAQANHLELTEADYRIIRGSQAQLAQYQLTLPLKGRYPDIRGFLAAVLSAVPTASLDNVAFERQKIGETAVQVTVRLTLYLRDAP